MKERKGIYANISKLQMIMTVITTVTALAVLLIIGMRDGTDTIQSRTGSGYSLISNVTCQEITDENTPIEMKKVYSFTIDDQIDYDTYLAFYTVHQYVEVRMEGKKFSA